MKKTLLGLALAATTLTAAPAAAHDLRDYRGHRIEHNHGNHNGWDQRRDNRRENHRWDNRREGREQYRENYQYNQRYWRGNDGRYYCRRPDGTTGVIAGAAIGGLLGHQVERGEGTVIGGVLGALIGREIERGTTRCLRR